MTNAVRPRFALLFSIAAFALVPSFAAAQELIADGPDLGWIGLGGMVACANGQLPGRCCTYKP